MEEVGCHMENTARINANKTAIIYCNNDCILNELLYNEIFHISDCIKQMSSNHVCPNSCIGIISEVNPILVPLIIGVHKCRCAFFCIDNEISFARMKYILNRLRLQWIFECNTASHKVLQQLAQKITTVILLKDYTLNLWKVNDVSSVPYENISYVMLTSGTTGTNKIVKVPHDCITSNIKSLRNEFGINNADVIFLGTPYTFDPFVIELFITLTVGATLLIVPPHLKHNKKLLLKALFPTKLHSGATFMQMPPSVFLTFSKEQIRHVLCDKSSLRILALGGENFPTNILNFKNRRKDLYIFNLYGITEVSCWASLKKIDSIENISLGTVLNDTILEVRDSEGNKITNGEGEMFIGSSTRICQVDDEKLNLKTNKIIFRATGDIVKVVDNEYYFVGRKNSIIKRFGQRICLLEIEKTVRENTELNSVCVWDEVNSKLILFVILQDSDNVMKNKIIDKLRIRLLGCLTKYQTPDVIDIVPSIPLNQNGKTDYKCLLKLDFEMNENLRPFEIFQNLWSKYFGLSEFQIKERQNSNFADFGGNSILALQIVSEFEKYFDENSSLSELIGILLDPKKTYKNYKKFIEEHAGSVRKRKSNEIIPYFHDKKTKTSENTNLKLIIKWKYNLDACVDSAPLYFCHSKLGGIVVAGSHSNVCGMFNATTGEVISRIILPDAIEGSACISPEEYVTIGCNDGHLYTINPINSEITWKFKTESSIKCTPSLCSNNTCIVFGSYDKTIYCVTTKDGVLKWKRNISEIVKSLPIVDETNKFIYVTTLQGSCLCLNELTGDIIYSCKSNNPIFGSPCLFDDLIIWADVKGSVFSSKKNNLTPLECYKVDDNIFSSIIRYKNFVLFSCHDCHVYCLDVSDNFREVFKINVGSQISTTPYVYNDDNEEYLITSNNLGKVHIFDFCNQELLGCVQLPRETFSSVCLQNTYLYIGCRDNNLYCIKISKN